MKQLEHLYKWYWSPKHPTTYTIAHPEDGRQCGLGTLIKNVEEARPAFNLTWLKFKDRLGTWDGHGQAVMYNLQIRKLLLQPAEGGTLGELSCLLSQDEFLAYCKAKNVKINLQPVR